MFLMLIPNEYIEIIWSLKRSTYFSYLGIITGSNVPDCYVNSQSAIARNLDNNCVVVLQEHFFGCVAVSAIPAVVACVIILTVAQVPVHIGLQHVLIKPGRELPQQVDCVFFFWFSTDQHRISPHRVSFFC